MNDDVFVATGRTHMLWVGIDRYANPLWPTLKNAVSGSEAFEEALQRNFGLEDASVVRLVNKGATLANIEMAIRAYGPGGPMEVIEDDQLIISFAGHGEEDQLTRETAFVPYDGNPSSPSTWFRFDQLRPILRAIPARHILVISDSCFSGGVFRGEASVGARAKDAAYARRAFAKHSRLMISSGGSELTADSGGRLGRSVFVDGMIHSLSASDGDWILINTVFQETRSFVVANAAQTPEFGPLKDSGHYGGEFVLFRSKSPEALLEKKNEKTATINNPIHSSLAPVEPFSKDRLQDERRTNLQVSKIGVNSSSANDLENSREKEANSNESQGEISTVTSKTTSNPLEHISEVKSKKHRQIMIALSGVLFLFTAAYVWSPADTVEQELAVGSVSSGTDKPELTRPATVLPELGTWTRRLRSKDPSLDMDRVTSLTLDPSAGFVLSGSRRSARSEYGIYFAKAVVVGIDKDFNVRWKREFGDGDSSYSIQDLHSTNGQTIAVGSLWHGDLLNRSHPDTSLWIASLDSSGETISAAALPVPGMLDIKASTVTDSTVLVGGFQQKGARALEEGILVSTNLDGVENWRKVLQVVDREVEVLSVTRIRKGRFSTALKVCERNNVNCTLKLASFSSAGNLEWEISFDDSELTRNINASGIASVAMNLNGYTLFAGSEVRSGHEPRLLLFSPTGSIVWDKDFETPKSHSNDTPISVIDLSNGNFAIGGRAMSSTFADGKGMFLIEVDQGGAVSFLHSYGERNEQADVVIEKPSGGYVLLSARPALTTVVSTDKDGVVQGNL